MALCLPNDLEQKIRKHCEQAYPLEACGLLIGYHDARGKSLVTEVVSSSNLSVSPENSFEIDPALIIHYQKKSRQGGGEIMGHYHSHPDGEAFPSDRDQNQNYSPELIWVIAGVKGGRLHDLKAYSLSQNVIGEVPITP